MVNHQGQMGFAESFLRNFKSCLQTYCLMFNYSFVVKELPKTLEEAYISLILKNGKSPDVFFLQANCITKC